MENKKIVKCLLKYGVKPNFKGFMFLNKAVKLIVDNNIINPNMDKIIYPEVAKAFDETPSKVERNIRFAIESSKEPYKYMSNKEFIALCILDVLNLI